MISKSFVLSINLAIDLSTTTSVAMAAVMLMLGVWALSVRPQQGRGTILFDDILSQTPENNTYSTFAILLLWRKSIDAMLQIFSQ
jgi:hypothetical protein